MKTTFESDDPVEIKRLSKAFDMALFIFDLKQLMRNMDTVKMHHIDDLLYRHNINIDDILE